MNLAASNSKAIFELSKSFKCQATPFPGCPNADSGTAMKAPSCVISAVGFPSLVNTAN